jgi:hypothetical protein
MQNAVIQDTRHKGQGAGKKKKSVTRDPVVGAWVKGQKRTRASFFFSVLF